MECVQQSTGNEHLYSPTDLITYMRSSFASWMDRFKLEKPEEAKKITQDNDPMLELLANKGKGFEQEYLQHLEEEYGTEQVVRINPSQREQAAAQTLEAMCKGAQVIFQGYIQRDNFAGFVDFLIKRKGKSDLGDYYYEACDTKLAHSVRPYFVLQLCTYSWMLEGVQGHLPEEFGLIFGDFESVHYRVQQFYAYFQYLKDDFLQFQLAFKAEISNQPDPALSSEYGKWESYAKQVLEESDSLKLVANIRKNQIKKLQEIGINQLNQLAETEFEIVQGIGKITLERLKAQARVQKASKGKSEPQFEIILNENGKGLSALPPASPLDIYFDIEGHPLVEGGLEYLWGVSYIDEKGPQGNKYAFQDWWAHTPEQEKLAFEQFIDWVYERWQQDSTMHIYHYAPYEITAIRKISNRYNTRTELVDELLKKNVFIDLYKIVKQGLVIGEPKYSLKNIEHLYRNKRQTKVASGDESIVFYEKWRDAGGAENWTHEIVGYQAYVKDRLIFDWNAWPELKQIRDYNIDDCESTLELAQWLRQQIKQHKIQYVDPNAAEVEKERTEAQKKYSEKKEMLQDRQKFLLETFQNNSQLHDDKKSCLLNDLIEYFVRESKAKAWEYFDRLEKSHAELYEDDNVIVDIKVISRTEEERKIIIECEYDENQPIRKDKFKAGTVLEYDLKVDSLKFEAQKEKTTLILNMRQSEAQKLPDSFALLGKDPFIDTAKLEHKICDVAEKLFNGGQLSGALDTILSQASPVFIANQSYLPITRKRYPENDAYINAIIEAAKNMAQTCLVIQGPPGAGKTFTANHVIQALLKEGKRVGILSNSHAAITNLMDPLLDKVKDKSIAKVGGMGSNQKERDEKYPKDQYPHFTYRTSFKFTKDQPYASFDLIGATAYALCDDEAWNNPLDYLFIDEASQVSLAHLVSVSGAAKNIIMMGDQMQLEQPTQGSHPDKAGLSSLQYYLGEHAVIPEDLGIFLERTFRMHPGVCEPLSKVVYEGKLASDSATANQAVIIPQPNLVHQQNGVLWLPVEHEGNTQSSQEEVDHIKKLIAELLSGTYQDKHQKSHAITENDILVVAPYNMQVNLLKEQLPEEIKVGTIDKFQGQEAPVVIVSMGVSDVNDSARGLDFVFDINRLNVAISRAKALAIIVSSSNLYRCQISTIEQMEKASFFCSLINLV